MTTIAQLISSSGAESLWQHHKFTAAGVPPSLLNVKKVQAFLPNGKLKDAFPRLAQHLQHAGKLSLLWAVIVKSDRITPYSLALVTTKQIMAKKEGTNVTNVWLLSRVTPRRRWPTTAMLTRMYGWAPRRPGAAGPCESTAKDFFDYVWWFCFAQVAV